MDFTTALRTNSLTNEKYVSAQLINRKSMDLLTLADELAEEGSSHTQSDIVGVLLLLRTKLPTLLYKGYNIDLGTFTLKPSVSGSITEKEWRASLKTKYMKEDDTLTEQQAIAKAAEKEFTASVLTSAHLTPTVTISLNDSPLQKYQTLAKKNWRRVSTANATSAEEEDTPTTPGNGGLNDD